MSYLICIKKTNSLRNQFVNSDFLKTRLCPYNLPIINEQISNSCHLYYNSSSSLFENILKTPAYHNQEICTAWSTVKFENNAISVQTDELGQCPLWYTDTKDYILISPEQKSFSTFLGFDYEYKDESYYSEVQNRSNHESDFKNIYRLKPGRILRYLNEEHRLTEIGQQLPWEKYSVDENMTLADAEKLLTDVFITEMQKIKIPSSSSFLSGGIDSSIASVLAKKYCFLSQTYNLKTSLGNEELESKQTSLFLRIKSKTIDLNELLVKKYFDDVIFYNEIYDGLTAEIILQMLALTENIEKLDKFIFTGYGSDLLFGGMLSHKQYMLATGCTDTTSLLERVYWSKELSPFYYWKNNKRLINIFWNKKLIEAALKIPIHLQQQQGFEKFVLRNSAVNNHWLPYEYAFRKKIGMTNGTQVNVLLSKELRLPTEHEYALKTKSAFSIFKEAF